MRTATSTSFVKPGPAPARKYALPQITMNAVVGGKGRPVVFIHGLGWDHSLWGSAMTRFSGRYLVIAGDMRGHGGSDKPDGPYSVEMLAGDWAALLEQLAAEKALIVGFSLGGMVAQQLALDYPHLVGGLILINTSCRSPKVGNSHMHDRTRALAEKGPRAAALLAAESVFSPRWRHENPYKLSDFVDWRVAQDQHGLQHAMKAASNFDVRDRIGSVKVPTRIVTALDDKLMLPSDQAVLFEAISHADCVEVADSGHLLPIERPDALETALEDFVRLNWQAG